MYYGTAIIKKIDIEKYLKDIGLVVVGGELVHARQFNYKRVLNISEHYIKKC